MSESTLLSGFKRYKKQVYDLERELKAKDAELNRERGDNQELRDILNGKDAEIARLKEEVEKEKKVFHWGYSANDLKKIENLEEEITRLRALVRECEEYLENEVQYRFGIYCDLDKAKKLLDKIRGEG